MGTVCGPSVVEWEAAVLQERVPIEAAVESKSCTETKGFEATLWVVSGSAVTYFEIAGWVEALSHDKESHD